MNNFSKKLKENFLSDSKLSSFYSSIKDNDNFLELKDNLDRGFLVTKIQANMGKLIGECLEESNIFPAMIMHTNLPSTPLCLIDKIEFLPEIIDEKLLSNIELINDVLIRKAAIKGFLENNGTFVVLYTDDYPQHIMDNLFNLSKKYPSLILKKIDILPPSLHGATYIVNEKISGGEDIFLASIISKPINLQSKDSLEIIKISIEDCDDKNFMQRLSPLNSLLENNGINLSEIIHLEKDL